MLDDCIAVMKRIWIIGLVDVLMGLNYMVNEPSRHLLALSTIF